jgi:hypothetical protein
MPVGEQVGPTRPQRTLARDTPVVLADTPPRAHRTARRFVVALMRRRLPLMPAPLAAPPHPLCRGRAERVRVESHVAARVPLRKQLGIGSRQELAGAGAEAIVDTPSELMQAVHRLLS